MRVMKRNSITMLEEARKNMKKIKKDQMGIPMGSTLDPRKIKNQKRNIDLQVTLTMQNFKIDSTK